MVFLVNFFHGNLFVIIPTAHCPGGTFDYAASWETNISAAFPPNISTQHNASGRGSCSDCHVTIWSGQNQCWKVSRRTTYYSGPCGSLGLLHPIQKLFFLIIFAHVLFSVTYPSTLFFDFFFMGSVLKCSAYNHIHLRKMTQVTSVIIFLFVGFFFFSNRQGHCSTNKWTTPEFAVRHCENLHWCGRHYQP